MKLIPQTWRQGAPPQAYAWSQAALEGSCRALADDLAKLDHGEPAPALAEHALAAYQQVGGAPRAADPRLEDQLRQCRETLDRLVPLARDRGGSWVGSTALGALCQLVLALARRDFAVARDDAGSALVQRAIGLSSSLACLSPAQGAMSTEELFVALAASGRLHEAWRVRKTSTAYEPRWLLNPAVAFGAEQAATASRWDSVLNELYFELWQAQQSAGIPFRGSKVYALWYWYYMRQRQASPPRPHPSVPGGRGRV